MTVIHECSQCGYQGRVVETADTYLCEGCYELYQSEERAAEICPGCGTEGINDTGLCYACENSPEHMPQPDC